MSVSFRYRLTKFLRRPSSCTRWRLRPPWVASSPSMTSPTVEPVSSTASTPSGKAAEGSGDTHSHGHVHTSLSASSDSEPHDRPLVVQRPAGRLAAASVFHPHDQIAVPRPGMLGIEARRYRGVVRMRMIIADDLEPVGTEIGLQPTEDPPARSDSDGDRRCDGSPLAPVARLPCRRYPAPGRRARRSTPPGTPIRRGDGSPPAGPPRSAGSSVRPAVRLADVPGPRVTADHHHLRIGLRLQHVDRRSHRRTRRPPDQDPDSRASHRAVRSAISVGTSATLSGTPGS